METKSKELPAKLESALSEAKKLEWITIIYLLTVVFLMYKVLGSSQAMRTAWLEDVLSIVPAVSFLVALKFHNKPDEKKFPYGFHRVFDIAFLSGSLALFAMGSYLIFNSVRALVFAEHPTIGSWYIFGHQIWLGWIMIVVLLYSSLPAIYIGRKKLPLAKKLHNKILFTDSQAQKADYVTAFAAIGGILGVGLGWWWADSVAATIISLSVLKDGFSNLSEAIQGLMDRRPTKVEEGEMDPLLNDVIDLVESWDWVEKAGVRFREHGQVYMGELLIVPNSGSVPDWEEARKKVLDLHWKIQDVILMRVSKIPAHYHQS